MAVAAAAQDSSAMKSIAILTMTFLPTNAMAVSDSSCIPKSFLRPVADAETSRRYSASQPFSQLHSTTRGLLYPHDSESSGTVSIPPHYHRRRPLGPLDSSSRCPHLSLWPWGEAAYGQLGDWRSIRFSTDEACFDGEVGISCSKQSSIGIRINSG